MTLCVVCWSILINFGANSIDPDQSASLGASVMYAEISL